jgi:hypothetical protein
MLIKPSSVDKSKFVMDGSNPTFSNSFSIAFEATNTPEAAQWHSL